MRAFGQSFSYFRLVAKILVIENEEAIRVNLARFLELESFQVLVASDGAAGLVLAKGERPDLVLCDLLMPGVDGDAVLAALRAHAETRSTPFIFLTASADSSQRELRLARGANDYLVKPVDLRQLLAAIRRQLDRTPNT